MRLRRFAENDRIARLRRDEKDRKQLCYGPFTTIYEVSIHNRTTNRVVSIKLEKKANHRLYIIRIQYGLTWAENEP